jgi:hypothetical protein
VVFSQRYTKRGEEDVEGKRYGAAGGFSTALNSKASNVGYSHECPTAIQLESRSRPVEIDFLDFAARLRHVRMLTNAFYLLRQKSRAGQ